MNIIEDPCMVVSCDVMNGWTVLHVDGEVDIHTSPMIRKAVAELLDEGHRHFVLDLCAVPLLDSMGLGMIVAVTKRLQDHQGSLRFVCADDRLLRVFRVCGWHEVYRFYDAPEEATRRAPSGCGLESWPRRLARS
ncbi:STAS domain-containing protein [Streptomyces carpinensis]|uniref:Anti-sigma factor antagonist n=1 Tax=Streptomyces carpinensis TaxID=66369 RepID=A0ABV1WIL3_9ACTN|nr:STAS domain-containing protein [Streptomyces carpinensis]